jgi:uncharacterized protein (DUF2225 family)
MVSAGEDIWANELARELKYGIVLYPLERMVTICTTCLYSKKHRIFTHVFLTIAGITSGYLPKQH